MINDHFEFIAAYLAERFKLGRDQIFELDRDWIYAVCLHPRDKDGNLVAPPQVEGWGGHRPFSFEAFEAKWRRHGVVDREMLREWWRVEERERRASD